MATRKQRASVTVRGIPACPHLQGSGETDGKNTQASTSRAFVGVDKDRTCFYLLEFKLYYERENENLGKMTKEVRDRKDCTRLTELHEEDGKGGASDTDRAARRGWRGCGQWCSMQFILKKRGFM